MSSSFTLEFEPDVRKAIGPLFREHYTTATLANAPEPIREVAERTGGLRSSQYLFNGPKLAPDPVLSLFGLWWPWADSFTISLRVGLNVASEREPSIAFRKIFDVSL